MMAGPLIIAPSSITVPSPMKTMFADERAGVPWLARRVYVCFDVGFELL